MKKKTCKHYWYYEHTVYEGRKENEVAVHRWCGCGTHQVAYSGPWTKPTSPRWDVPELKRIAREKRT